MNVAVAVAIGIIATLLVAGFGTIFVLMLLAMRSLQRMLDDVLREVNGLRSQFRALDAHVDMLAESTNNLVKMFREFNGSMAYVTEAAMRSAQSVSNLASLLTTGKAPEVELQTPNLPNASQYVPPRMDGPRPNVPANPMYDHEAPKEDGADIIIQSDEELALEQDRQEAREQGFETDPNADFPIPIQGVGADVR